MALYSREQLERMGFAALGEDVRISDKASIYGAGHIRIGNHVRIDDFCVLSAGAGGIDIGSWVHIAVYSSLIGAGRIQLQDFSNISSRVSVYSSTDDFSGEWMTNPMVPAKFTGVSHADVSIGRHAVVGSGSVILPGVTLEQGVAIGALSLVKHSCREFTVHAGTPARRIGERKRDLLERERAFLASLNRAE